MPSDLWVPTHLYNGIPVRLDSKAGRYRTCAGNALSIKGWDRSKLVPAKGRITFRRSLVSLVLKAADPNPGRGIMPGYAVDMNGNCATLVSEGVVKLCLKTRDGDNETFLVELPESIELAVTALEMKNDS